MALQHTVKAAIRTGEQSGYVAECVELPVVTQGQTLDEVAAHLKEAVARALEGEEPSHYGLVPSPTIEVLIC